MKNGISIGRLVVAMSAATVGLLSSLASAQTPTMANVAYGTHAQQKLDFYKANSTKPTPVMFYIHGGAWVTGDKANPDFLAQCLASGISVVSINYRLITGPSTDGTPPVKAVFDDTARALQFVRSQAAAWNIDKTRVAAVGGSAGGFNALLLATKSDQANPASTDPIARESTRVTCAMGFVPQTTLDPHQMTQWMPGIDYGQQAFGLPGYQQFYGQRDTLLPFIQDHSPYYQASADDAPMYLFYGNAPALGTNNTADLVHSANWGAGFAARLDSVGAKYQFNYPGATNVNPDMFNFMFTHLTAPVPEPTSMAVPMIGGVLLAGRPKGRRRDR